MHVFGIGGVGEGVVDEMMGCELVLIQISNAYACSCDAQLAWKVGAA